MLCYVLLIGVNSGSSVENLHEFYEELQQSEDSERLVYQLENFVENVVVDARRLQQERRDYDEAVRKERDQHQQHLKTLEEELELQVQNMIQLRLAIVLCRCQQVQLRPHSSIRPECVNFPFLCTFHGIFYRDDCLVSWR